MPCLLAWRHLHFFEGHFFLDQQCLRQAVVVAHAQAV